MSQAGFIQGTKATLAGASEGDEALVSGNDVVAVHAKEGGVRGGNVRGKRIIPMNMHLWAGMLQERP